mmetsp:Transcript_22633/g.45831  ORF Transcript_22633/g.45831 Transcript_22633/m.45831 type:complete len:358 (-) Transcript_22633:93-1166(-)
MSIRSMTLLTHSRSAKSRVFVQAIRHSATSKTTQSPADDPRVSLTFRNCFSVAKLSLHNPARRNALTYSMMDQLDRHVYALDKWSRHGIIDYDDYIREDDDDTTAGNGKLPTNNARAVILTGSGGNFCSGLDLRDQHDDHADASSSNPLREGINMTKHMARLTNHLISLPILSISAVDGYAIGGGAELTTCTDIVVLSRDAKIQFVHAKRGASMGWGGGRRLVKKVGRSRALKMLLLGESVLGEEEAHRLNSNSGSGVYADFVANSGESAFDAAIRRFVNPILHLPCSQSIRAIKSVVSVGDGDRDVIDCSSGSLLFDSNNALRGEIESFTSVWGGESNKEQIRKAKENLKMKKDEY